MRSWVDGLRAIVSKEYKSSRGCQTVRRTGRDPGSVVESYVAGGMRVHKNSKVKVSGIQKAWKLRQARYPFRRLPTSNFRWFWNAFLPAFVTKWVALLSSRYTGFNFALRFSLFLDCEQSLIFLCKLTARETKAHEWRAAKPQAAINESLSPRRKNKYSIVYHNYSISIVATILRTKDEADYFSRNSACI